MCYNFLALLARYFKSAVPCSFFHIAFQFSFLCLHVTYPLVAQKIICLHDYSLLKKDHLLDEKDEDVDNSDDKIDAVKITKGSK